PLATAGTIGDVEISHEGGFVVFSLTDFSRPNELFRLNVGGSRAQAPIALTSMNAAVLADITFGDASSFSFAGWNGEQVQAWQIRPPNFDAAKKYPLLLMMHGGPESAWLNQFHYRWNAQ